MHFSTVKFPINSGLDWPWISLSFLIPKLIRLHCGGVHWECETVPCLFQCWSGTVSQSLHQCTWRTHSQSVMGPLLLSCLISIKQNHHLNCFTVWLFHNMTMLCHILILVAEGISAFNAALVFTYTCFINHISRPLSSSMCSITPETANVGSSHNRMRGPGIGCWFSDRSNCSHWSLTLTFTLTSENLSLYTTLLLLLVLIQLSWLQQLSYKV